MRLAAWREQVHPQRMTDTIAQRDLALAAAAPARRAVIDRLLALDDRMAEIVRTTREPLVGQMRLTWWREALERLDTAAAPAEPLLRDLEDHVLTAGIAGAELAAMVDGWEVLFDPLDEATVAAHGTARGGRLFALAGRDAEWDAATLSAAGEGWALADLAAHMSRPDVARLAADRARTAFAVAFAKTWPRSLRPLGGLALLRMLAIDGSTRTRNYWRFMQFRMFGR